VWGQSPHGLNLLKVGESLDKNGRVFGVSVIDALIVIAVVVMAVGFVYNRTSAQIMQIIMADTPVYVTLLVEGVSSFSVNAINENDTVFRQHERTPAGTVHNIEVVPARAVATRTDGTAVYALLEDRFDMYVTIVGTASVTDMGVFLNGTIQLSPGGTFNIQTNRLLTTAIIHNVEER
ncbi:MAG: DUF4330 domain-containing protein, partial [Turicibacter sp.]|nr:DUF4330 domain-containing protein [Turicibacter sp.]